MKLKQKLVFIAALFAAGCAHSPALNPDKASPEMLSVEGSADFDARDPSASSARAVADAKKKAVLRAAELYMDETSISEKWAELESGLVKNLQYYVTRYEIMSEGQDGSNFRVRLKVWVNHTKIASALRGLNLAGPASSPRAALVQKGQADASFLPAFRDAFSKRSAVTVEDYPFARDAALVSGPEAQLLSAASAAGASLLMAVTASVAPSGAGLNTGFYPSRAKASVIVYEVSSGKVLLDLSNQADAIDSSQQAASSKALASAAELLAQETAVKAARLLKQDASIKLKFYGLDGLETLEKLKAQLTRLDVKALSLESYSSGTAVFEVVPRRPDPQELASAVLRGDSLGLELEGTGAQEAAFSVRVPGKELFLQN